MKDISNSQTGGESAWRGLDYQKKFIAYLSLEMLLQNQPIRRITCEHFDDVEVEEDSKLLYYQVKSTTNPSLPKSYIIDSIRSFSSIESSEKKSTFNEYILVSNAKIGVFNESMEKHPFNELAEKIKNDVNALEEIKNQKSILDRIYVLKGPALEDISSTLTYMISKTLKDRNFTFDAVEGVKRDLLYHISNMCPGPIDLEDKKIVRVEEKQQRSIEHKTLNVTIINKIIESNQPNSAVQNLRRVSSQATIIYNIMPSRLDSDKRRKIHELIQEYESFSEDDELRFTYLQKFSDYSNRFELYKDNEFLEFLKGQIQNSNNKHIIFELLFILHKLIVNSKLQHDDNFIEYVNKEHFPFLKENLVSGAERYEYSFSKIEQIIEEIRNVLSDEEICEIYWNRMVNMIRNIRGTDVTTNRLWNCINALNNYKCKIRTEWRKWLITKDEHSDIKNAVLKEISHLAFL